MNTKEVTREGFNSYFYGTTMKHEYNITPEFFRLIKIGDKNFLLIPEANYEIGDRIAIYEKVNAKDTTLTGRGFECVIDHVESHDKGLDKGYCIIGLHPIAYQINVN